MSPIVEFHQMQPSRNSCISSTWLRSASDRANTIRISLPRTFGAILLAALATATSTCATSPTAAWERAKGKDTMEAYLEFIERFPQAAQSEEASSRIDELEWDRVKRQNTILDFTNYIRRHPRGRFAEDVQLLLEELDWAKASSEATLGSYESFLSHHPNGRHALEAAATFELLDRPEASKALEATRGYEIWLKQRSVAAVGAPDSLLDRAAIIRDAGPAVAHEVLPEVATTVCQGRKSAYRLLLGCNSKPGVVMAKRDEQGFGGAAWREQPLSADVDAESPGEVCVVVCVTTTTEQVQECSYIPAGRLTVVRRAEHWKIEARDAKTSVVIATTRMEGIPEACPPQETVIGYPKGETRFITGTPALSEVAAWVRRTMRDKAAAVTDSGPSEKSR